MIGADGGTRVLHKIDEIYTKKNRVPAVKWNSAGVMIWCCFWFGGLGPRAVDDDTLNQVEHINTLANSLYP
jgi:hypothetical protein